MLKSKYARFVPLMAMVVVLGTAAVLTLYKRHLKLSGKVDGYFIEGSSCACGDAVGRLGYCQMYEVSGDDQYIPFQESSAQAPTINNTDHCSYNDCFENFFDEYHQDERCEIFAGIVQADDSGRLLLEQDSQTWLASESDMGTGSDGSYEESSYPTDVATLSDGLPIITEEQASRVNPPINRAEPPLPAPWIINGVRVPAGQGHCGPPDPYDIYSWNCHSNTNLAILTAPANETRGACICNDPAINTPAWHSFAWSQFEFNDKDYTCIWNYGDACCYESSVNPPDLSQGDGLRCARWACNPPRGVAQFTPGRTRCLAAGQQVEIPGPAACVRQVLGNAPNDASVSGDQVAHGQQDLVGNRQMCLSCCDQRANMWGGTQPAYQQQFLSTCRTLCRGHFGDGRNFGTEHGNYCSSSTSFFSIHSRYEQCRGCCLNGARTEFPLQETNDCLAVCRNNHQ